MEAQYQGALAQVGIGHEGAREQEEYNRWAKKRAAVQAKTARERGRVAIRCGHSRYFIFVLNTFYSRPCIADGLLQLVSRPLKKIPSAGETRP